MDRWLFAYPEKVPYPKFNDVDIDERIAANWTKIIQRILSLPFEGTPKVVKLSPGAKALYKEWFDNLSNQKNNGGSSFAGLVIAERYGMPERTFKRWLSTSLFRKITHGFYEKRYR